MRLEADSGRTWACGLVGLWAKNKSPSACHFNLSVLRNSSEVEQ